MMSDVFGSRDMCADVKFTAICMRYVGMETVEV